MNILIRFKLWPPDQYLRQGLGSKIKQKYDKIIKNLLLNNYKATNCEITMGVTTGAQGVSKLNILEICSNYNGIICDNTTQEHYYVVNAKLLEMWPRINLVPIERFKDQ